MAVAFIILAVLLWVVSLFLQGRRQLLAPAASYLGLLTLSFATGSDGLPLLPINNVILIGWLCMTLVVMTTVVLQPAAVRAQKRGTGYMTVGALAGMSVGLLGFTVGAGSLSLIYGLMILATAAGTFFGFLLFTNTPDGAGVNLRSGRFFKYLLAKGFPIAIAVMMTGVAAVVAIATYATY